VALKDPAGSWAGVLRLHKSYSSLFTFFLDSDAEGQPCELIAISRGVASNGKDESYFLDEWTAPERPTGFTRYESSYEFYNVLWIEWKGGIAYRKALGRVIKETWDRQALEWIDITLG
jgi:hypothetical protein